MLIKSASYPNATAPFFFVCYSALSLFGGLIRILTTIKEVGWDMNVLGTYILSSSLNLTMFVQYFVYQSNTQKFLNDLKTASEKKES